MLKQCSLLERNIFFLDGDLILMPLPLAKLVAVAIRQAAKPAASYMQKRAETNPTFRRICIRFATCYHTLEYRLIQSFYERKIPKVERIPKLNEKRAVELGTTLFGELILFSTAAVALFAEYHRGQLKEAARERRLHDQLEHLETHVAYLLSRIDSQPPNEITGPQSSSAQTMDAKVASSFPSQNAS